MTFLVLVVWNTSFVVAQFLRVLTIKLSERKGPYALEMKVQIKPRAAHAFWLGFS
jgi:hypothetical protein